MDAAELKKYLDPKALKTLLQSMIGGSKDLLGVDLGSHAVKILHVEGQGADAQVKNWAHLPLELTPEATPEQRAEKAANVIRSFHSTSLPGGRRTQAPVSRRTRRTKRNAERIRLRADSGVFFWP